MTFINIQQRLSLQKWNKCEQQQKICRENRSWMLLCRNDNDIFIWKVNFYARHTAVLDNVYMSKMRPMAPLQVSCGHCPLSMEKYVTLGLNEVSLQYFRFKYSRLEWECRWIKLSDWCSVQFYWPNGLRYDKSREIMDQNHQFMVQSTNCIHFQLIFKTKVATQM